MGDGQIMQTHAATKKNHDRSHTRTVQRQKNRNTTHTRAEYPKGRRESPQEIQEHETSGQYTRKKSGITRQARGTHEEESENAGQPRRTAARTRRTTAKNSNTAERRCDSQPGRLNTPSHSSAVRRCCVLHSSADRRISCRRRQWSSIARVPSLVSRSTVRGIFRTNVFSIVMSPAASSFARCCDRLPEE